MYQISRNSSGSLAIFTSNLAAERRWLQCKRSISQFHCHKSLVRARIAANIAKLRCELGHKVHPVGFNEGGWAQRNLGAVAAPPVRLSDPHFDDQPRCNDAECSERSYDYAKDKLTGFAPFRLYPFVLKARILLRKPLLSLDTLFSRQVSHVADPKFVPDLGSAEALKASAILVRYCHLSRLGPAGLACSSP
jgi:hypothetical protein